tara:strand:+ start:1057 stop:1836 length:780 start_codon:yes stop_codon:yes gene_type:complete
MTTRIPTMYGRYYVLTLVWRGREYDITVFRNKLQKLQRPQAQKIANSVYPNSRVIKYHESDPTEGPVILTTEGYKKGKKKKRSQDEDGHYDARSDKQALPPVVGGIFGEGKAKNCGCGKTPCITYGKQTKVQEHNDGSAKNCKKGEYFCKEDHKCKPIPKGHHVMPDGMLMKGKKHSVKEGAAWTKKSGKNKEGGLNEKGRKSYERENPGSDLKAPSKKKGNKRRKSFCARMKGMRKRQKPSNNTGDDRLSKSLRAWNC